MTSLDSLLQALGIQPFASGLQLFACGDIAPDPTLPLLAGPLDGRAKTIALAQALRRVYPPGQRAILALARDRSYEKKEVALEDLAQAAHAGSGAYVYVPPAYDPMASFRTLEGLLARLRAPDGCPWDREQTHTSLRSSLLEETYEVLAAIDQGDTAKLPEELGDLLLQVVFQSQIGRDAGEFSMRDVISAISEKLVRRHPHVFGNATAQNAWEVEENWERIRRAERQDTSLLDGVPREMPALAYSQAIQQRAARTGFDWDRVEDVYDKIQEEIQEMREAGSQAAKEAELGDVFFALVNLGRKMGLEVESALRTANARFFGRFAHMEHLCRERGLDFQALPLGEKDRLWEEAKAALG